MAKKVKAAPEPMVVALEPLILNSSAGQPLITINAEAVGQLRGMITRLLDAGPIPQRISFASALRREGVTYLTQAFGAVLASDLQRRVGVVELNWHWPSLGRIDTTAPAGVAEVLAETQPWEAVIQPTSIEQLKLIPAGELAAGQRAVVARSQQLHDQITELASQFDHLLIDVPAVLATTDAIPLAGLGESCCIVVRQGVTPRRRLMQALDDIKRIPMLGVVMNKVRIATPEWIHQHVPQE